MVQPKHRLDLPGQGDLAVDDWAFQTPVCIIISSRCIRDSQRWVGDQKGQGVRARMLQTRHSEKNTSFYFWLQIYHTLQRNIDDFSIIDCSVDHHDSFRCQWWKFANVTTFTFSVAKREALLSPGHT